MAQNAIRTMNQEQREKLYREARATSRERVAHEKAEKARLRSVKSAERYCKLRALEMEKERERQKDLKHLRETRNSLEEILKMMIEWREQLQERCQEIVNKSLDEWRLWLDEITIASIERDIPRYNTWLCQVEAEIKAKRRKPK